MRGRLLFLLARACCLKALATLNAPAVLGFLLCVSLSLSLPWFIQLPLFLLVLFPVALSPFQLLNLSHFLRLWKRAGGTFLLGNLTATGASCPRPSLFKHRAASLEPPVSSWFDSRIRNTRQDELAVVCFGSLGVEKRGLHWLR